jgi:hypothetical protein
MTTLPVFIFSPVLAVDPGRPTSGLGAALVLIVIVMVLNLVARSSAIFSPPRDTREARKDTMAKSIDVSTSTSTTATSSPCRAST